MSCWLIETTITQPMKCGRYTTLCTNRLIFGLMMLFSSSARPIGAGKNRTSCSTANFNVFSSAR